MATGRKETEKRRMKKTQAIKKRKSRKMKLENPPMGMRKVVAGSDMTNSLI